MQSEQPPVPPRPDGSPPDIAGDALQRRRLLLRGVGKGAAVAAAVVPIQSLATPSLIVRLCTVSGVQSNVGSGRTGGTTATCQGFAPGHFADLKNWPGYSADPSERSEFQIGNLSFTEQSPFNANGLFGNGSNSTLIGIFTLPNQAEPDQVWAAALLSAVKKGLTGLAGSGAMEKPLYFPYTASEVLDLYNSSRKEAAESFFRSSINLAL